MFKSKKNNNFAENTDSKKEMMKHVIIGLIFLSSFMGFSQKTITHKVVKGETITKIAQQYQVTPLDIFKLNPDAQAGISENTILVIPKKSETASPKSIPANGVKHTVVTKETFYSISRLYGTTVEAIQAANPNVKGELNIGQVLVIPNQKSEVKHTEPKKQETILHEVKPQETKYGIAKQYGLTIEELEKKNPEIVSGLPVGAILLIKGVRPAVMPKTEQPKTEQPKTEQPKVEAPVAVIKTDVSKTTTYVVKPQETVYSLSNQFGITQDELLALNPSLKEGLREGMTLEVPAKKVSAPLKNDYKDITKSIKTSETKKIALLLPFNLNKLDKDTVNSTQARLKKDKFLNMTLDFYSGALMAIDSLNKMGAKFDVTILDSGETKSGSSVGNLISQYNLKSYQAVIGPFYQNNAEKAAELLGNVPVFSPLSKDYDKAFTNLIQATPSDTDLKLAMFDYIRKKGGNAIGVIDVKKQSSKQFLVENFPEAGLVNFTDKGALDVVHLKELLSKEKVNYVIMDTEKTNLILNLTSTLQSLLGQYQIRLVITGENSALDYEEIPMNRLTKLQMLFPSQTKDNLSDNALIFEKKYRKYNKILPNYFATRGFDVTFDAILRVCQNKEFSESMTQDASEQIENRFNYVPSDAGGFINKGIYILYYDADLTIKEAN